MSDKKIYLNTASCGLLSPESVQASAAFYDALLTESSSAAEQLRDTGMPRIRETVASFLGTPSANIAFVPNFSFAINSIVHSLKGTEKVLLYDQDYPSLLEPFRINKFDITWIGAADGFHIDSEELKALILDKRIDLLVISHVQWLSGYRLDLEDIGSFCRKNGVWFIVDATQSLGAVPVDLRSLEVDVLIASNYKWMNAGFGTGVMYMSDRFLDHYPPAVGGFGSYTMQDGRMTYEPSTRSYEPGHLNLAGLLVLEAAVTQKLHLSIEEIARHNGQLTSVLLDNIGSVSILGPATMENRSSIVFLQDSDGQLHQHLLQQGFTAIRRNGYIRISFHFQNTQDEVSLLVASLNAFAHS